MRGLIIILLFLAPCSSQEYSIHPVNSNENLTAICEAFGGVAPEGYTMLGCMFKMSGKPVIFYDSTRPEKEIRDTLAHEKCHVKGYDHETMWKCK